MIEVSQATACVCDHGLGIPVAQRLAKAFKRVLYYCASEEGFPTINRRIVGYGMDGIEKCEDFWRVKNEVDVWCFPDIGFSGLQKELRSQGRSVWGSGDGDSLEIYRQKFHKVLGRLGLEVAKYVPVRGLNALREHLKTAENKYIKISEYRGTLETKHWRSWDLDEGLLDVWGVKMGPAKELITFLVFDAIDTPLEIGGDTYNVNGKWPSLMLHGDEAKDKSYLGVVTKREDMPEKIQEVLEAFGPELEKYGYANQFSMEIRVLDYKGYFTDPCCRIGLPSTMSQLLTWKNYPEIVLAGAHGELVDPEPGNVYATECVITTHSEKEQWSVVCIPDELKEWTGFGNCFQHDGKISFPADESQGHEIGWLCATGDTPKEVIDNIHKHADALPDGLDADTDALVDLLKEIAEAGEQGIKFGDKPIPEPEAALNL